MYGKPSSNNNPGASPPETASESEAEMDAIFAEVSGSEGSEGAVDSDNDSQEDLEDPQVTRQAVQEAVGPSSQRKKSIPPKLRDEAVPESQYNLPAGTENPHFYFLPAVYCIRLLFLAAVTTLESYCMRFLEAQSTVTQSDLDLYVAKWAWLLQQQELGNSLWQICWPAWAHRKEGCPRLISS